MKQLYLILSVFMLSAASFAQGNKEVVSVKHVCTIDASEENATFTFDDSGRVVSAQTIDVYEDGTDVYTTTYEYGGSTFKSVTVIEADDFSFQVEAVGQMSDNRITEIRLTQNMGIVTMEELMTMSYDSEGHIIGTKNQSIGERLSDQTTHVTWDSGNLTHVKTIFEDSDVSDMDYQYDMSKLSPRSELMAFLVMSLPFELTSIQMLLNFYPHMGYHSRNLPIGYKETGDVGNYDYRFAYEFDSEGDITKIEVYEGDKLTEIYTFGLDASGIHGIEADRAASNDYYSLQGNKVKSPRKGLYVRNGRKVVVR